MNGNERNNQVNMGFCKRIKAGGYIRRINIKVLEDIRVLYDGGINFTVSMENINQLFLRIFTFLVYIHG